MGTTPPPVRFDHREPGTTAAEWVAAGLLIAAGPVDLTDVRRLIVVAAHPDDETLGAGGLIATAAAAGVQVTVIVATAGEASHPGSPTMRPGELAAIRGVEVRCAVARLASTARVVQLDLGDGRLGDSVDSLTGEIHALLVEVGTATLIAAPWRQDGHPDHAAAAEAARRVAARTGGRLLEFPLWAWHWARPGDGTLAPDMLTVLNLSSTAHRAKQMALAEYRSQIDPLSPAPGDEAIVPAGFRDHFNGNREVFVEPPESLDRQFFDDFYAAGADPWGFDMRWYEKRKRAITLASLPRERFAAAFEPGCAIGVLTAELAQRCDTVLATDIAAAPLVHARRRLARRPGVTLEQRRVPQDWPTEPFDLIVLSEIGYYCGPTDLSRLIEAATSSMTADGVLLACHWRHPVTDYPTSGDEVHARLLKESGLDILAEHVEQDFLLHVLVRSPAESVARRNGLLG